jgi:uncharacterized membrane protein HdeD (DUF308 family)
MSVLLQRKRLIGTLFVLLGILNIVVHFIASYPERKGTFILGEFSGVWFIVLGFLIYRGLYGERIS